jgi:hypothetical protein
MTLGDLFMFVSSKENILEKEKRKNKKWRSVTGVCSGSSSFSGYGVVMTINELCPL